MSRKLIVPEMLSNLNRDNRDEYLRQLKEAKADRLFIAVDRCHFFENDRSAMTEKLAEYVHFFEAGGIEVGAWVQAFGFGNPLTKREAAVSQGMTKIKSVMGNECGDAFCPEDPQYMERYCAVIKSIARAKPTLLMLDDDLCLSVRPGIGCFCDNHMQLLEKRLGRPLNKDTMARELFTGAENEARRAWLDVMGDSLRKFCRTVRQSVDEVDPSIRVGFCAGFTSWDIEGADAIELSNILAGDQEPFLRFTGAPYWVAPHWNRFCGQRLHGVIEFAREQEVWCKNTGIECFSEADSYPRPRYHIPGNLLECFDAAMIASGNTGDLKYLFDYFAPPTYETGYLRLHKKNQGLHAFLEDCFWDKKPVGVRVFERMHKFADMELPERFAEGAIMETALPLAAAVLTSLCVPVHYEEDNFDCAIAFGENVLDVKTLPKYMILDMKSALILQKQGVDVGILEAKLFEDGIIPFIEEFPDKRITITHPAGRYYDCCLKDTVKVESYFVVEDTRFPAVLTCASGNTKFLILNADAYSIRQSSSIFCSYARQEQILKFYSDFPVIRNSPFVYQLCKREGNETVAFFANIFEDELWDFEIELDRIYQNAECYGIEAELKGDRLHVTSAVPAYGMFAVKLRIEA